MAQYRSNSRRRWVGTHRTLTIKQRLTLWWRETTGKTA